MIDIFHLGALLHKSYDAWSHLYSWDTQLRAPLANKDRSAELMVPIIEVATSLQANYATMPHLGVKLMTIKPFLGEEKSETKRRYYNELLEAKEAIVAKGFDRSANLNDMEGVLPEEAIVKNIRETHEFLLPTLKEAKYMYLELSDMLHGIRKELKNTVKMMAYYHKVKLE